MRCFVDMESTPPLLSEQWAREFTGHTDTEMSLSDARGNGWQQATVFIGAVAPGMSIDLAAEQAEDPECDFVIRFLRGELKTKHLFDARFALMPERAQSAVQAYRGQDPNFKRLSMVDGRLMSLEPDVNWKVPIIPFKLRERFGLRDAEGTEIESGHWERQILVDARHFLLRAVYDAASGRRAGLVQGHCQSIDGHAGNQAASDAGVLADRQWRHGATQWYSWCLVAHLVE